MKRLGLFLEAEASAGGIFQYSQAMVDAFAALSVQYELAVACTSRSWAPYLEQHPFRVTWLKHAKAGLKLAALFKAALLPGAVARPVTALINPIAWQLKALNCDLWLFPGPDAIAYQLPVASLISIHDLMHRYERRFPEVGGGYRYYVRDHRFGEMARWSKGILVDSKTGRDQVVKAYGVDPAKIHPLPYIPPRYIFAPSPAGDADRKYGLPPKYIFYPAQLWAHKNHESLIDAVAAIKSRHPEIHLVLTGKGRHRYKDLLGQSNARGVTQNITFLGYVPDEDLPALYRGARALVMPTFLGPTNIPPLEAFACDCPVAVSGIYGMPEQLGDAALYFDPNSVSEIADAVERLWIDDGLCETLRARGRQKLANWNQDAFNHELEKILAAMLPGGFQSNIQRRA